MSLRLDELLSELKRMLPPPEDAVPPFSNIVKDVTDKCGISIPDSYIKLASTYGAGWVDDFLRINAICETKGNLQFKEQLRSSDRELSRLVENGALTGLEVWPSQRCIIPWAVSSNGDSIFMDQEGSAIIAIDGKRREVEVFNENVVEFLCNYLQKNHRLKILPDDCVLDTARHAFDEKFGTTFK